MTATTEDRAADFERHATLEALSAIVSDLADFAKKANLIDVDPDLIDVTNNGESWINVHDRLWPNDEGMKNGEFYAEGARAFRLAAEIVAELAGPFGQSFLISELMELTRLVAFNEAMAERARAKMVGDDV